MSDRATELFERYVAARRDGRAPDPLDLLDEAGPAREELASMLVPYLASHPRADVPEQAVAARAALPASEPPAGWDVLIPRLRERRGTTRGQLAAALAAALGHPRERRRVGEYLHELEVGELSPRRVRPPVVDALARILGAPREVLERARSVPPSPPPAAVAYSRMAVSADAAPPWAEAAPAPPDELDDLFTGGDG
jgi:hypothetical protein